jgi:hypothetical protein
MASAGRARRRSLTDIWHRTGGSSWSRRGDVCSRLAEIDHHLDHHLPVTGLDGL